MQESLSITEELKIAKAKKNKWNGFADRRPSDYVYALMSQQVYEGKRLKKGDSLPNHKDWTIERIRMGKSDYFGVIYKNQINNQIVVTHQGSANISELKKELAGYPNGFSQQKEEALDLAKQAIEMANKLGAHLSFTGHASAALLAVLNLFLLL